MKKICAWLLVFLMIVSIGGCADSGKATSESKNKENNTIKKVGTLPPELTSSLIDNHVLELGTKTDAGYLVADNKKPELVSCYQDNGKLVWQKKYIFGDINSSYGLRIVSVPGGGFFVYASAADYQKEDNGWYHVNPVLARCDQDGNVLWKYEFKNVVDPVKKIWSLSNGDIITIGNARKFETFSENLGGQTDIYLSKFSSNGIRTAEKVYGGSDFDSIRNAEYIQGKGIAALIGTQSKDGTFSASKDGYGNGVLALFDESLNLLWYKIDGSPLLDNPMITLNNHIYLLKKSSKTTNSLITKYDLAGKKIKTVELEDQNVQFIPGSSKGIMLQGEKKVWRYNHNLNEITDESFHAGRVGKIVEFQKYYLVLSVSNIETPSGVQRINRYRIVYSGYNYSHKLLWRDSFE